jgi:hypothetical protein
MSETVPGVIVVFDMLRGAVSRWLVVRAAGDDLLCGDDLFVAEPTGPGAQRLPILSLRPRRGR